MTRPEGGLLPDGRGLRDHLRREWNRSARYRRPLALIIIDVDFFHGFNQLYGQVAGDVCLELIKYAVTKSVRRSGDYVARDQAAFVALLPESEVTGARHVAVRIQAAIDAVRLMHDGSSLGHVSVSLGIADAKPDLERDSDVLLDAAYQALAEAKAAGRNRTSGNNPSRVPALRVQPSQHNLIARPTPFIGRAVQLRELELRLADRRLVTVLGKAGAGKSRLALEVAVALLDRFEHGVWHCDLALVPSQETLAAAVAMALRLSEQSQIPMVQVLRNFLRERELLLILDTCENLAPACAALLNDLLAAAPRLRIIATSRTALNADEEVLYPIEALSDEDATDLFLDRAAASNPLMLLSNPDRALAAAICSVSEQLPMAVELAAARASTKALDDLLADIKQRAREKHRRSLDDLIDWNYQLLADAERALLRRLSVFAGHWSIESACDVCTDETISPAKARDAISVLVNKSLIMPEPLGHGRLRMLDAVREYAHSRLVTSAELEATRRRYAAHWLKVAQDAFRAFVPANIEMFLRVLDSELDQIRSAIELSLVDGGELTTAAELMLLTGDFWLRAGRLSEARYWTRRVAARAEALPLALQAAIMRGLAILDFQFYDLESCSQNAERGLQLCEQLADPSGIARMKCLLGALRAALGSHAEARMLLEQSIAEFDRQGLASGSRFARSELARISSEQGEYRTAADIYRGLFDEYIASRDSANASLAAQGLAINTFYQGDIEGSEALLKTALELSLPGSDVVLILKINLAYLAACRGSVPAGREQLAAALLDLASARPASKASAMQNVWWFAVEIGRADAAAQLVAFLSQWRDDHQIQVRAVRSRYEEMLKGKISESLGPSELERLSEQGRRMSWDEAVALALSL